VCTILVHAGSKKELLVKDTSGLTPAQLAADKGHRHLANVLVCTNSLLFGNLTKKKPPLSGNFVKLLPGGHS
jgi:hypothetical protein